MNGEHPSKERLQRHHDGELSEQDAADVRQHVRTCAACRGELDELERLAGFVRWSTDEAAAESDVDFTRMFAEIERAVAEESPARLSQPGSVVPLPQQRGVPRALPVLGALALAAAALLMINRDDPKPADGYDQQLALLDASQHSEVTAVKFGRNAGQVFGIPLADGRSVPVVWIDDEDDEE